MLFSFIGYICSVCLVVSEAVEFWREVMPRFPFPKPWAYINDWLAFARAKLNQVNSDLWLSVYAFAQHVGNDITYAILL